MTTIGLGDYTYDKDLSEGLGFLFMVFGLV